MVSQHKQSILLLMAEDDEDDRLLTQTALRESSIAADLHFVEDGEELLDYLHRRGKFAHLKSEALPGLILLDLNMPRKDGREALQEIRSSPALCHLPVVVLTTSQQPEDVRNSYALGANSYITKPARFDLFIEKMELLSRYWFEMVELP